MRSVLLRSLAVIGLGGALLAAVLYVASTVDARAPEVVEIRLTQPIADESDRALITTSLEVAFNEEVDQAAAARALRIDPAVPGSVSWSGSTMIFTPADPLELETAYSVSIEEGVRDLAGNEMATLPPAFVFETAGRPTVVETDPVDGASDVPVDTPIAIQFSSLMDTTSVEADLRLRPTFAHELRWSGERLEIVPREPLTADRVYEVTIGAGAADVAGVELGEPVQVAFRTVAPGLAVEAVMPADGIDGIATTTPIAIVFDRPIDPDSVRADLLSIEPNVAGTLELVALPGDPEADDGAARVLRFAPSGPLPPNTTFDVTLDAGVTGRSGGGLADALTWTFTTGAPSATLSNQITFITDRAGVANVWAMNADGTGQRQLTAELSPVLDYAVAPDGSSIVVGDGYRLVFSRPDGSDRRVLTEEGDLDFDPAYAPDGATLAFARADAATGAGLGLWTWEIGGGDPERMELPSEVFAPSPSDVSDGEPAALRAPRFAPDGQALAFVDTTGRLGILELSDARLTAIAFRVSDAPAWLPDSAGILVTGESIDDPVPGTRFVGPVQPLGRVGAGDAIARLGRSATRITETAFASGSRVAAIATDGTIAVIDADGDLRLADGLSDPGEPTVGDARVLDAAFAPGEPAMVIVVVTGEDRQRVELLDLDRGDRTTLAADGGRPRWLP